MIILTMASIIAAGAALPLIIFSVEAFAGLPRPRRYDVDAVKRDVAVLIPAHNEAAGICAVVAAIAAQCDNIIVVADNCTDATAANARSAGARVVERTNLSACGKGYALDFGRQSLIETPPDIVIIMDADCVPHTQTLATLAQTAALTGRVVQCRYELETRAEDSPITRISNFAFSLKNVIRQRGLMRIAGTCVLTGTGMAFPWDQFRDAPLATADSVEDLAIGLALVRRGTPPIYLDQARVTSPAATGAAAVTQRTRWEHGFIATAANVAPAMLGHGITRFQWRSIWLGLHLMVPPLALTFGLAMVALIIVGGLGFLSSFTPALILAATMGCAGIAVLAAWSQVGRDTLPMTMLLRVPLYVAWKLPIYLKLTRGADRRWTRTERD